MILHGREWSGEKCSVGHISGFGIAEHKLNKNDLVRPLE